MDACYSQNLLPFVFMNISVTAIHSIGEENEQQSEQQLSRTGKRRRLTACIPVALDWYFKSLLHNSAGNSLYVCGCNYIRYRYKN